MRITAFLLLSLCAASAQAADFCPPLASGRSPVVVSEFAAIEIAKPALIKQFTSDDMAKFEPFKAEQQGEIWHVYGSPPPEGGGGSPAADVCRATGEVLNVYRSQ
ncbi:MAG: hypothetical protein JWR16_1282 [Nevskia sp.]|nr:hypothetical protein [Nevskia sp.]